jgi:hypothetical protein
MNTPRKDINPRDVYKGRSMGPGGGVAHNASHGSSDADPPATTMEPHLTGLPKDLEGLGSAVNDPFGQAHGLGDRLTKLFLTMFIAKKPSCLSKSFRLDASGALLKEQGGKLCQGEAHRLELTGLSEFADLLERLTPENALSYGVSDYEKAIVVPHNAMERETRRKREHAVIARTRDAFRWPEGPGIMMLDYDPAAAEEPWPREQLLEVLCGVCPELERSPHLWRPSASSCIYNSETGENLRGIAGQRTYLLVADASDIRRAGEVLFKRLWLAGYGRIDVSKSGSLLERAPVDSAVWQPERLDFCGGAYCKQPVTQRLPRSVVYNTDAMPLEKSAALPDLTGDQEACFKSLVSQSIARETEAATTARTQWIERNHSARLERLKREKKPSEEELAAASQAIKESLKAAVEADRLYADHELILSDGHEVTVSELLDNRDRYHGARCHDPVEPDYPDERIAYINLRAGGRPYIWSRRPAV